MVLVVVKNLLRHGTWTSKRSVENHLLTTLNTEIRAIARSVTDPSSNNISQDHQGHPSVGLASTSQSLTTGILPAVETGQPPLAELDVITAASSPATLVQEIPSTYDNGKESMVSGESSLHLNASNGAAIPHDVEAQHEQNQGVEARKKFSCNERLISDATLGLSDGMTVPFALTAGLSSFGDARLVYLGGLAELFAGAVSMGLGGYIAAKGEEHSYIVQLKSTKALIAGLPDVSSALIRRVFEPFELSSPVVNEIVMALLRDPERLLEFLMKFHLQAIKPDSTRPAVSALTIGGSYLLGGLVPLIPYFCVKEKKVLLALYWSIGIMAVALFAFGWTKTAITGGWKGKANTMANAKAAFEMVLIGAVAAGVAVGLIRAVNHRGDI